MNINGRDLSYTVHSRVPYGHLNPDHYADYQQALAECDPGRTLTIHEKRLERPGSWQMRWVAIGELWL